MDDTPYSADRTLYGKLRRRLAQAVTRKPARLHGLARPLLTLSFDDAPVSAAENGARILARHGLLGTYFISAGLMGKDSHLGHFARVDEVKALAAAGHEIACHTFSHLDCGKATAARIACNLDQNLTALRHMGIRPPVTFAYPYGDVSPQAKTVLDARYLAARALHHGLITTGSDLNQAPAVGIEGACGEQTALAWLDRAAKTPSSWLVLYTHDVRAEPSDWGCTPEALDRLIVAALGLGFDIVPFAEGARRAQGLSGASERSRAA